MIKKTYLLQSVCLWVGLFSFVPMLRASATAEANEPLYLRKYHIRVSVSFAAAPAMSSQFRKHVLQSIKKDSARIVGEVWDLQIVENQHLQPANKLGLSRLQANEMRTSLTQLEPSDILDVTQLIEQFAKVSQGYEELMAQAAKAKKKPKRKQTPAEQIWLSLSKELQKEILVASSKTEEDHSTLLPKIVSNLNTVLQSTKLIPRAESLTTGMLSAANRDRIITAYPNLFAKIRYDKALLITVQPDGSGFQLSGIEYDESTQRFSDIQQEKISSRRSLALGIVQFLTRLFHPHFEITNIDNEFVTLLMQGSAYPTPDPFVRFAKPGDHLQPLFRYLDRRRLVQKIQFLEYTYLQVKKVENNKVTCQLISGVRSPLGTGRRRRVDTLAVGIKLNYNKTYLKLMPRRGVQNPLVGYRVTVVTSKVEDKENKIPPVHLISNRDGNVAIATRETHQLLWLFIRSGQALLARLPLIPGYHEKETIPLGDDAVRLRVEGEVAILKGDLVDLIARRATTMARARRFAKNGKQAKVDEMVAIVNSLPGLEEFKDRLSRIQVLALEAAEKQGDRLAKSRIRSLCTEAGKLIKDFLDNEKLDTFLEEMKELEKNN